MPLKDETFMIDPKKVRMAMYQSTDGPRIMLFGPMEADFAALQNCFQQLRTTSKSIQLDTMPWIENTGGISLRLQCAGSIFADSRLAQGLRNQGDSTAFIWTRTAEGWDYLHALVDGLVHSPSPGHQYLTRFPDEDAIIVISKGEYTDDVLK